MESGGRRSGTVVVRPVASGWIVTQIVTHLTAVRPAPSSAGDTPGRPRPLERSRVARTAVGHEDCSFLPRRLGDLVAGCLVLKFADDRGPDSASSDMAL